jgi:hypothetical protein
MGNPHMFGLSNTNAFNERGGGDYNLVGSGIFPVPFGTLAVVSTLLIKPTVGDIDVRINGTSQPIPITAGKEIFMMGVGVTSVNIGRAADAAVSVELLGA